MLTLVSNELTSNKIYEDEFVFIFRVLHDMFCSRIYKYKS